MYCLRYKKKHLLRRVLHPLIIHSDVEEALALSFKDEDQDSENDIFEYLYHRSKSGKYVYDLILNCVICTILYDKPLFLHKVLEFMIAFKRSTNVSFSAYV